LSCAVGPPVAHRLATTPDELLELEHVDGTAVGHERIPAAAPLDSIRPSEQPPQRGHLPLERVRAPPGDIVAPHDLEETVVRDHLSAPQRERDE
jgi:hypothetical protein